jgi:hypothetical protein
MPRTAIALQTITRNAGAVLTEVTPDAVNGNNFVNDGKTELVVHNGDAAPHTCTVRSVACSHGRTGDIVTVVAAGKRAVIGPLDQNAFNQPDGTVNVDWDASTSVKVQAVQR